MYKIENYGLSLTMIKNLTYNDPIIKRAVDKAVGKEFSFFQGLKMGGTGSQKFVIEEASDEIIKLLQKDNATNFTHIEQRPNGIIIRFKSYQETYGLILSFQEIKLINDDTNLTIESPDFFVKMKTMNDSPVEQSFLNRIDKRQ